MIIAPEAYPLSCKNRKRDHDEDEILVRVLIDSKHMFLKWISDRKEIAIPMISRLLCFQYPKFYAVRLSQFSRAWSLVASLQNTKDV